MKKHYFIPGARMKRGLFAGNALFKEAGAGSDDWGIDENEDGGEDGGGSGDDEEGDEGDDSAGLTEAQQREALLTQIRSSVKGELSGQDNKTKKFVRDAIEKALKDVNLNALRSFKGDKIAQSVRNLAKQQDELKALVEAGGSGLKKDRFKELVEKRMKDIEGVMNQERGEVSINMRAAVTIDTGNVITGTDFPEDFIESFSFESFSKKRRPQEYVSDIADVTTVAKVEETKIWYSEGTEEGAFAIVAEGELKPLISLTVVRNSSQVAKAAGKMVFTEEFAKFRPRIYGYIRELFNDKVYRDYQAILTTRLIAAAAAYPGTALDGTVTAPTDFHAIGAVASAIETLNFNPDVLIINPQDKWRIALTQDTTGQFFLMAPQMGADGVVRMMQFRVVTTNRMAVGKFILGESGLYKIEQEGLQLRIGYGINVTTSGGNVTAVSHDFDHNRFRMIAELFFHSYIKTEHQGSFIYGDFAAIKTALEVETP